MEMGTQPHDSHFAIVEVATLANLVEPELQPYLGQTSALTIGEWEILTDGGWRTFNPGLSFEAGAGREFSYQFRQKSYRVTFQSETIGEQEHLTTSKTRPLRLKSNHIRSRNLFLAEFNWEEWSQLEQRARDSWAEADALCSCTTAQWRWHQFTVPTMLPTIAKRNPLRWSKRFSVTEAIEDMARCRPDARAVVVKVSLAMSGGECTLMQDMEFSSVTHGMAGLGRVRQSLPFLLTPSRTFEKMAENVQQLAVLDEACKALDDWNPDVWEEVKSWHRGTDLRVPAPIEDADSERIRVD